MADGLLLPYFLYRSTHLSMLGLVQETENLAPVATCSPATGESRASDGIADVDGSITWKISDGCVSCGKRVVQRETYTYVRCVCLACISGVPFRHLSTNKLVGVQPFEQRYTRTKKRTDLLAWFDNILAVRSASRNKSTLEVCLTPPTEGELRRDRLQNTRRRMPVLRFPND